ncbi:TadE/TadG family type IV pilus assembly protein [Arthrobacter sp. I3]|uniref:TadE/TadG family type IV pilus assembly protein n=1 Tax=Arthrobacter sp. I3 TaxID=218158 RepID=UPI0005BC5743|nr:TadE/TadG family type IV pilus assembly protein [Arthrobacter sp. I3]
MKRSNSRAPRSRAPGRERGSAAVEFALVAPLLLSLVVGIVELSYTYNLQISVTQAAREAARTMAVKNNQSDAIAAALAGAPGLSAAGFTYSFTPTACAEGRTATVNVTYTANTLTNFLGSRVTLRGTGAMRCGG